MEWTEYRKKARDRFFRTYVYIGIWLVICAIFMAFWIYSRNYLGIGLNALSTGLFIWLARMTRKLHRAELRKFSPEPGDTRGSYR